MHTSLSLSFTCCVVLQLQFILGWWSMQHGLLLILFRCGTIEDGAREQVQHRDLQALLFYLGVHFYGSSPFSQEIRIKQYTRNLFA